MSSYIISLGLLAGILIFVSFIIHDYKKKPKEEAQKNLLLYSTIASVFLFFFIATLRPTLDYVSERLGNDDFVEVDEMVLEEVDEKSVNEEEVGEVDEKKEITNESNDLAEDSNDEEVEIITASGDKAKISREELDSINKLIDDMNKIEGTTKTPRVEVVSAEADQKSNTPKSQPKTKKESPPSTSKQDKSKEKVTENKKPAAEPEQQIDFGDIEELEVIGIEVID